MNTTTHLSSATIPEALKTLDHWLLWRLEQKGDAPKLAKVPYCARTFARCNPVLPENWSCFSVALNSFSQSGFPNGLGFSLTGGIVCVDLDNSLDPNGNLLPWAKEILTMLGKSYTEISQSGCGLHWFAYGTLPGKRSKFTLPDGNTVELYEKNRYIAVTGRHLEATAADLVEAQAGIDALYTYCETQTERPPTVSTTLLSPLNVPKPNDIEHPTALLDRMFASKRGNAIKALWDGDTQAHHGDDSAADLALMAHLAYWCCGDAQQMEALFSQSALAQREKWQRRADYRASTINKALEGYIPQTLQTEAVLSSQAKFISSKEDASLPTNSLQWEPLIPFASTLAPVPDFDIAWLPECFQPWVDDCADRLQCPADFIAVSAMVVLATVVGRKIGLRPKMYDSWQVVPNLWGMIIGPPSILKSPALNEPMQALHPLENAAKLAYQSAERDWEAEKMIREERQKMVRKNVRTILGNKGDAFEVAQNGLSAEEIAPPKRTRFIVNDSTIEKLGCILADNPNGLLLFRDEMTGFFHTMDKTGHESDRAFYLECWNGDGRFTYDRIGRGTLEIESACLSILGGIQPGPLQAYLAQTMAGGHGDDGLMQRFQLAVYPDISPQWQNVDRMPDMAVRKQAFAVIESLSKTTFKGTTDDYSPIPYLRFAPSAQEGFTEWRTGLEHSLRQADEDPWFVAHLAKYRSLIPAMALLIELADIPDAQAVSLSSLEKALAWESYLRAHARRIYGSSATLHQQLAKRVIKELRKGKLTPPFTARDIHRHGWAGLTKIEVIHDVLALLEAHNAIQKVVQPTGGRDKTLYYCHPEL